MSFDAEISGQTVLDTVVEHVVKALIGNGENFIRLEQDVGPCPVTDADLLANKIGTYWASFELE